MAGTAGAGGMAPPASTRISVRLNCVHGHSSPVNVSIVLLDRWWRDAVGGAHKHRVGRVITKRQGGRIMVIDGEYIRLA